MPECLFLETDYCAHRLDQLLNFWALKLNLFWLLCSNPSNISTDLGLSAQVTTAKEESRGEKQLSTHKQQGPSSPNSWKGQKAWNNEKAECLISLAFLWVTDLVFEKWVLMASKASSPVAPSTLEIRHEGNGKGDWAPHPHRDPLNSGSANWSAQVLAYFGQGKQVTYQVMQNQSSLRASFWWNVFFFNSHFSQLYATAIMQPFLEIPKQPPSFRHIPNSLHYCRK